MGKQSAARQNIAKQSTTTKSVKAGSAAEQRRETRHAQREQRRIERERLVRQEQRARLLRRVGFVGGTGVLVALVVAAILNALGVGQPGPVTITGTGTYTTEVSGETRDGMSCLGSEGTDEHIHMYLAIYANGKQVQVAPNTGIVNGGTCFYPLHVHSDTGDENIIHEESPNLDTYTLGAFFDVWGQPLSRTQVMSYKVDATHTLTFVTFDGSGHKTVVTGSPLSIPFSEHETIYILYNSPNVTLTPFANWLAGE